MGQYWIPVNLTKKEFINPHRLGTGLKLWEQLANHPGTPAALIILCAAMREPRGGGDFDVGENWHGPERTTGASPGPMPTDYESVAARTIGRWAGDRIALVGDYAEMEDLPEEDNADLIYSLCSDEEDLDGILKWYRERIEDTDDEEVKDKYRDKIARLSKVKMFTDISEDVCRVIEHELQGKFEGTGWRTFVDERELKHRGMPDAQVLVPKGAKT